MSFNSSVFRFLVLITSILTIIPQQISAATIEVDVAADNSSLSSLHNNGTCSLREAIQNANSDNNAYTDCEAGAGADVITFNGASSITLVDDISVISDIQIQGTVTLSGGNNTRIFAVGSSGILRLVDVTLQNGKDASGGAILQSAVSSTIECSGSTFENNKADFNGGAINSSGTLNISGCTFENNQAADDGGAMYKDSGSILDATLTIDGSNFSDNLAGTDAGGQTNGGIGGAIRFSTSIANITGSRFDGNSADSGTNSSGNSGGGAIHNDGIMNITASVFAGNSVSGDEWHGGAIFNGSSGALSVNFSHFGTTPIPLLAPFDTLIASANAVSGTTGIGGAIYTLGEALILGSSFIGNSSANHGGAIGNGSTGDELLIANSSFSQNTATNFGGAIYHLRDDVLLTLRNVSIAGNSAAQGGGIYNDGDGDNSGILNDEILLQNVILSSNTAAIDPNCGGGTVSSESVNSISFPASSTCANAAADTSDPAIGAAELTFSIPNVVTYAFVLGAGSSALGSGDDAICAGLPILNLDQRGLPRPVGDISCDIGAYESSLVGQPTSTPTPTATATFTATNTPTITNTPTPTFTATLTATASPTVTATIDVTATFTATATITATYTNTATATTTPTASATFTATNTPTASNSPTLTPTATNTATSSATATPTMTASSSATATPTTTATNTTTATPTVTQTPAISATFTATATATNTASPTSTTSNNNPDNQLTATPTTGTDSQISCTDINIQSELFAMDGIADSLRDAVNKSARTLRRKDKTRSAKIFSGKIINQAQALYVQAWITTWTIPSVLSNCINSSSACITSNYQSNIETYKKNITSLSDLISAVLKYGNKTFSGRDKKLFKSLQKSGFNSALLLASDIPTNSTNCS